jgi:predicted Zn-dependent protease
MSYSQCDQPQLEQLEQLDKLEQVFDQLVAWVRDRCQPQEQFTLKLNSEHSQFTRFNRAKVRQTGSVRDGRLVLTWMQDQRSSQYEFPFTGNWAVDQPVVAMAIAQLRQDLPQLPLDPYLVVPSGTQHSREVFTGKLLPATAIADTLLPTVAGVDFTGLYAAGWLIRGYADSAGQKHWFATDTFVLDYSLFADDGQAVKGTFAGSDWDPAQYAANITTAKQQLALMARPPKPIGKGQYRTYLAPAAVADLIGMLSWGAVSESSLRQGSSALAPMRQEGKAFSPLFTLHENFQRGLVPRFNNLGEVAPLDLPIIVAGQLTNTLINSRTAKEYDCVANGANGSESLRSPQVQPGRLPVDHVLATLGTGLYLSNLHYLNWSDRPTGRITGMTRYACFWVENGEIVAPIENLRFDESLYRFWGENLVALTDTPEFIPEVGTYENRQLGGTWTPGMIVEDFTYTL